MKIANLFLTLFLASIALIYTPAMAQTSASQDISYEMFEDRVCKLMSAPYTGAVVVESSSGCQWKLTDAKGQPLAGETLTATASFGIDDKGYRYMLGYFLGGYMSLVQASNGKATLVPFKTCQKIETVGGMKLWYSFRFDQDDGTAPPETFIQFHCDRAMISLKATGKQSRAKLEALADNMEALVRTEQSALDQAPQ